MNYNKGEVQGKPAPPALHAQLDRRNVFRVFGEMRPIDVHIIGREHAVAPSVQFLERAATPRPEGRELVLGQMAVSTLVTYLKLRVVVFIRSLRGCGMHQEHAEQSQSGKKKFHGEAPYIEFYITHSIPVIPNIVN